MITPELSMQQGLWYVRRFEDLAAAFLALARNHCGLLLMVLGLKFIPYLFLYLSPTVTSCSHCSLLNVQFPGNVQFHG